MTGDGRAFPDPRAFYEHIGRQDVLAEFDKAAEARSEWERKYLPFNIARFSGYGLIGLGVTAFFLLATPGTLIGVVGLLAGLAGGGVLGAALAAALAVVAPIAAAGVAGGVVLAIIGLSVGGSIAAVGAALLLVHYLLAPREIPEAQWPGVEHMRVVGLEFNRKKQVDLGLPPSDLDGLPGER